MAREFGLLVMQLSVVHFFIHKVLSFPALVIGTGFELYFAVVSVASFLLLRRACLFRPREDVVIVLILLLPFIFLWSWLLITPYESVVLHLLLLAQQVILVLLVFYLLLLLLSSSGELRSCIDEACLLFLRLFFDYPLRCSLVRF